MEPFVSLVTQLLTEDNNTRKQAERALEEARTNAFDQFVLALATMIQTESLPIQCRVLSAVLLRKQLPALPQLKPETSETLKNHILQALEKSQDRNILRPLSYLTSSFAGFILSEGGNWDSLLNFLVQWTQSPNELRREISLDIFSQLLSHLLSGFEPFFDTMQKILATGLQDPCDKVRLSALKGMVHFLVYRIKSREVFQPLLPQMFEIVTMGLTNGDEELARAALEGFVELAEFCPQFFEEHLERLLDGMFKLSSNRNWEDSTRFAALEFFLTLCEAKPSCIRKLQTQLTQFVSLMLNMMTQVEDNPDWNEGVSEDLDDEESDLGMESLDRTALAIRGVVLVPILFSMMIPTLLKSEDWRQRRAALMAISTVGEGCIQVLTPNLDNVMEMIFPMFRDSHERVRWAACNTVGQLATDFGPFFQMHYAQEVLQNLVHVMDDEGNPRVQSHAAAAVINFCDHCEPSIIEPYLQVLLQKLDQIMKQGKMIVLEQAITAVAAIADCSKKQFIPFYDIFMPFFKGVLQNATGEAYSKLRGKAMEAISLVAVAVGLETFAKDAKEVLDLLLQIQAGPLDDLQVPFLQQAWARLCKALGPDFVPYLPALVPTLLRSAQLPADLKIVLVEEEATLDEEKWQKLSFDGEKYVTINMARVQEKTSALTMLYWLADEMKEHFFPYVESLVPICKDSLKFYHCSQVRIASSALVPCIIRSTSNYLMQNQQNGGTIPQIKALYQEILGYLLSAIDDEPQNDVLITLLNSLQYSFLNTGKLFLLESNIKNQVKSSFENLLNKYLKNRDLIEQKLIQDPDGSEGYYQSNLTSYCDVFVKLGEVTSACIQICGPDVLDTLVDILAVFKSFLGENAKIRERYTSNVIFNSLVRFCGDTGKQYYQSWIPYIIQNLNSDHPGLRKTAAYGIMHLSEFARDLFPEILAKVINCLNAIIVEKTSRDRYFVAATQTAIAAVGRIIEFYASRIDLKQVLPIWLNYLPVTHIAESDMIYKQLCHFMIVHTEIIIGEQGSNVPHILQIFANIIGTKLIQTETLQGIISILKKMQNEFPADVMQRAWVTLTQEQQQKLTQALS